MSGALSQFVNRRIFNCANDSADSNVTFFFNCHDSKEERFTPDKHNPVVYLLPHVTALRYQRKAAALTSFPTWPEGITVKRITAGGVTS